MKNLLLKVLPWIITIIALYWAFVGLDWEAFTTKISEVNPIWLSAAVLLTALSYLIRSYRWQYFFPDTNLRYADSVRVLILGFFMNNVLPARTGELVRAHVGSLVTGSKRTLVLATIASERLVDGLTLSLMFVALCIRPGATEVNTNLMYVACAFGVAAIGAVTMIAMRSHVFTFADKIGGRLNHRASDFAVNRLQVFIEGLSPLCSVSRIPVIAVWSLAVWFVELGVFACVAEAFNHPLSLSHTVIFLVAVNFSSLIPSAPGAIGVIELIAKKILVSIGVPGEVALPMVIAQHGIQYLVIAIPGLMITFFWKNQVWRLRELKNDES